MSERQWERLGSITGIGFVAAMIASVFMAPTPPHIDASTSEILDYVTSHRTALLGATVVGALAGLLFLVFLGHLRQMLQRSEGGAEALSPIVYGAGLTLVAVAFVLQLPLAVLAFGGGSPELAGNAGIIRLLYDLNALGMATMMIVVALFIAVTSVAMLLREMGATVLGWIGLPVAVVNAAAGVAGFYNSSYQSFWNGLNYVGLIAFAVFVLAVSVDHLIVPLAARPAPAPRQPIPTT
ncbi:MAG TPA: hypothetical protein VGO87_15180 [Acidimicrobiia bacterium]|jgi:hypothetical protein